MRYSHRTATSEKTIIAVTIRILAGDSNRISIATVIATAIVKVNV
ncbi:hypothetical protein [Endozoicomonas euniceicola]|uniref:Uncharacterized protein n=1 Tax=Endozoicomonas euniceicola TaxID=1234143 RepID=A0ABY6GPR2_9GAMM|nr:hypothetical protein [Endozoicomonas euniceicola]UYM14537.1 hypothetical protein NX720_16760 [Endozoicomonas euniceicola]